MGFSIGRQVVRVFGVAVIAASALLHAPEAAAEGAVETITVEPGTHKLLRAKGPVSRVAVGEPKIADVNVVNGREVLINGKAGGVTSLLVWTRGNGATEYRIAVASAVAPDPELAALTIQPGGSLDGSTPSLLAHRKATLSTSPRDKDAPAPADRSFAGGETQVMSQVKIVEVNRTTLQQYGINLFKVGNNSLGGIGGPGSVSGVGSGAGGVGTGFLSATGFLPIGDAFNIVFGNNGYTGILSVLERKGLARTLAEPSLTALSGQTASFLAGGEFPYPVPQGGGAGNGTITVQFREFGVRLNLTPTVLSNNRIAIKVAPEVSDLDFTNSVTIQGTTIPGIIIRRTDTTVELGDGETFVLSGLVSNNLTNNVDKVPWLGDIPVLGAFFRSTSINRTEKELIMIITPHLVRPFARGTQVPALPGASLDSYRPNFAETIFLETGDFGQDADTGYSK
ncbi:type II and III secretion system protein family protein [Nevskia sp.]|uniref:type II and III secretion system protein family protein n=1 Tax=Nevskia sp. TaxID=1929292 RepID=UPI0025DDDE00|nr:type II and III secretion system protein family protein [Nevskia sp.]